jgi:hypothetical protein
METPAKEYKTAESQRRAMAKYREVHREKILQQGREAYYRNRDKILEQHRQRYYATKTTTRPRGRPRKVPPPASTQTIDQLTTIQPAVSEAPAL